MGNCREMSEVKFSEKQIVETSLHKTNYVRVFYFLVVLIVQISFKFYVAIEVLGKTDVSSVSASQDLFCLRNCLISGLQINVFDPIIFFHTQTFLECDTKIRDLIINPYVFQGVLTFLPANLSFDPGQKQWLTKVASRRSPLHRDFHDLYVTNCQREFRVRSDIR